MLKTINLEFFMRNIQELLNRCLQDISLLTDDVHTTIISALDQAVRSALSLNDTDLMFTYRNNYLLSTQEVRITYRFKYGSMTVETILDRIFVTCEIDVIALNVIDVPFGVVQFSLTFDNYLNYEYAYFTHHFYVYQEKQQAAILHLEQRNYVNDSSIQASGRIVNVNNSFLDLSEHGLAKSYLSKDVKFINLFYDFLNLQQNAPIIFNEVFEEFVPYLNSMNSLHVFVDFLNLFSDQYYNSFEALERKFLLFEMKMI